VLELGPAVRGLREGERVALLCDHAFASEVVVPTDRLCALPFDGDFPGEAFACAYNIFQRSRIVAGRTVAVVGSGFLGGALIQLASHAGARVIAISRRAFSLRLASRQGAAHTLEASPQAEKTVQELTGGAGVDVAIECGGVQDTLDLATRLLRQSGRLVIAGFHQDGPRQIDLCLWNWKAFEIVNAHERDAGKVLAAMQGAARAVRDRRLDPTPLLTHSLSIEQLDRAFGLAEQRPEGFVKATVSCSGAYQP
jgi:threonine dehydrogenase-like Zn-dependent dehydrogenase